MLPPWFLMYPCAGLQPNPSAWIKTHTAATHCARGRPGLSTGPASRERVEPGESGADEGTRTLDLRFTKPLLFRLSYIGVGFIVPPTERLSNRPGGGVPNYGTLPDGIAQLTMGIARA